MHSELQSKITPRDKKELEYTYTKRYIKSNMPKIYSDLYGDLFKIFLVLTKPNLLPKERNTEKVKFRFSTFYSKFFR